MTFGRARKGIGAGRLMILAAVIAVPIAGVMSGAGPAGATTMPAGHAAWTFPPSAGAAHTQLVGPRTTASGPPPGKQRRGLTGGSAESSPLFLQSPIRNLELLFLMLNLYMLLQRRKIRNR